MRREQGLIVWLLTAGMLMGCLPNDTTAENVTMKNSVEVPVLMYHHFAGEDGSYTVSAERFRAHLAALTRAGYETVTFAQLEAFAAGEGELPEKPVLLTADDGYTGVLTYALPVLAEYDMVMSVAVIGVLLGVGGDGRIPHFSLEELMAADAEGRLEVVSHSYALHGTAAEMQGAVNLTLPPEEYEACLLTDCRAMAQMAEAYPGVGRVFVYPYGAYSTESEWFLAQAGYTVTVTTDYGVANITAEEELTLLPRIPAEWYKTGEALLAALT